MKEELITQYQTRITSFEQQASKISTQINRLIFTRVLAFLAGSFGIYFLTNQGHYTWAWLSFFVWMILFIYLVKWHTQLKARKQHFNYLVSINQAEINALQGNISQFEAGKEFLDVEHPYMYDLDILGERSIFQYLNRTCSALGKQLLADWLKYPTKSIDEILARQAAAQELKSKLEFRQHFQADGMIFQETVEEKDQVLNWLQEPVSIAKSIVYKAILYIFPIISIVIIVLAVWGIIPASLIFLPMIINLIMIGLHSKKLIKESQQISQRAKFLEKYVLLFQKIENEQFSSPLLKKLQKDLAHNHKTASQNIAELAQLIHNIETGASFFGLLLNGFFLWSLQYLYLLEKWQMHLQADFSLWFQSVAQIDALSSLGNLAFNKPNYTFPKINEANFVLQAREMGHPLLNEAIRIDNEVDFKGVGELVIITGANMAGKSTYLRTVGVNLVLAMCGAPVCAKSFEFRPIDIYTSMRTKDSLQENESFFYAELKRLKTLIDILADGREVFIILDEILKGTNSADQHTGSKALIEQLIRLKGVGLIATHDLTLSELIQAYPQNIRNQCFEIEIQNNELVFDYKLRNGINQNLNATFLMKKMGITV